MTTEVEEVEERLGDNGEESPANVSEKEFVDKQRNVDTCVV